MYESPVTPTPASTERLADQVLIRALRADPRASVSALAKSVHENRAAVSTRLHGLLDSGAVRVIGAMNPGFQGLSVMAHVSIATLGSIEAISRIAEAREEVVFLSAVAGEFDLVMELRVHTHNELHTLLEEFRAHPTVARLSTVVYSKIIRGAVAHDDYDPIDIDDADYQLIRLLQLDGRTGYQALSDEIGLSPSAIRSRLDRLLASRVLKIGLVEARGIQGSRMTMGIGFGLRGEADSLHELLLSTDSVEFATKAIGTYDAVATISRETPTALFAELERLRSFPAVTRTTSWVHLRSIKESYARRI